MNKYAAADQPAFEPSPAAYVDVELVPDEQGQSNLAPLEPELETTASFSFNFIERPRPQPTPPTVGEEILTRLLTPWSLAGLLLLVAANGLLTIYSFAAKAPGPTVAVANFDGLPPIAPTPPGLPPVQDAASALAVEQLSAIAVSPPVKPSPAVPAGQTVSASGPSQPNPTPQVNQPAPVAMAPVVIPPPVIPQAQPVPMTGYSPYLNDPGYRAAAPTPRQAPAPSQSLPTIAIQPLTQPAAPLPPPPPPPVNFPGQSGTLPPAPVNYAAVASSEVASQMYQQLPPPATNPVQTAPAPPANTTTPPQISKNYNQNTGTRNIGGNLATQQLVQELESLNQAPY